MNDLYDMVKDNPVLRKQKAAEYGVGIELPGLNCTEKRVKTKRAKAV